MVTKHQIDGFLKNRRPYTHAEIDDLIRSLESKRSELTKIENDFIKQLKNYLDRENALIKIDGENHVFDLGFEIGQQIDTTENRTQYSTLFRPTVSGSIKNDFAFSTDLRFYFIKGDLLADALRTEVRVSQGGADFVTAGYTPSYAKIKLPFCELLIGRNLLSWGPGRRGNLLLSPNPLAMEMIQIRSQFSKIGFQAFTAAVEGGVNDKILSAHRLDLGFWKRVRMGIAEVIVIAKENFEVRFLNPFNIYTVTEASGMDLYEDPSKDSQGNLQISGDLEIQISRNFSIYGELLIDDFQPNYGFGSLRNWATKFAIQIGSYWIDPFSIDNSALRFEYSFVNQFVYTHRRPSNIYTHYDRLIGHEIGTDADDFWLNFDHRLSPRLSYAIAIELERHGEGNVDKFHAISAPSDDLWKPLSGITETTHRFQIETKYHTIGKYFFLFRYNLDLITNFENRKGDRKTEHEISLTALYRF